MLTADLAIPRPSLVHTGLLERIVERIGETTTSQVEIWHHLTEHYAVDLDALAAILPASAPDPVWLRRRD